MVASPTIDASKTPALRQVVEEMRAANAPVVIQLDGVDVAIITPVLSEAERKVGALTKEQFDSLMSAAGGWKDIVDTEDLKKVIREQRGQAPRE